MKLFLLPEMIQASEKIVQHIQLMNPLVETIHFDGEFYRFRMNDAQRVFNQGVYVGGDVNLIFSEFEKMSVNEFFKSNNNEFWLTGTDLAELIAAEGVSPLIAETQESWGVNYANKLIEAYTTSKQKYGLQMKQGVPDSIVVFDPLVNLIFDPMPYLKGMDKAIKEKEDKPKIYLYAGDR